MKQANITVNEKRHEVSVDGKIVPLARKEYLILLTLMDSGNTMSREDISKKVWTKNRPRDSRTIDQHISRIRRKMRCDVIITVSYFGYKIAL